jgi:hypothetical protein
MTAKAAPRHGFQEVDATRSISPICGRAADMTSTNGKLMAKAADPSCLNWVKSGHQSAD